SAAKAAQIGKRHRPMLANRELGGRAHATTMSPPMLSGLVTVEPAAAHHELSPPFTGIGISKGSAAPWPKASAQQRAGAETRYATVPALPPTRRSHSVLLLSAVAAGTHTLRLAE